MKYLAWIPVALLLGLVIGAWAPRADLRRLRGQLDAAGKGVKEQAAGTAQFDSVSRFLRIPDGERPPVTPKEQISVNLSVGADSTNSGVQVAREPAGEEPAADDAESAEGGGDRADLRARIEEAADLWRMRADIARATFVANTALDKTQAAQFDVLVASMNLRLRQRLEVWAEELKAAEEMGPETGMRMINDLTEAMVLTYDEIDRTLPADWRERSGGSVDLTDFIDPSVATPLIDVEDKLQRGPRKEL